MVVFDFEMNKSVKKILTIIFIVSTLISHYSTAYVAFVLILPILLLPFFEGLLKDRKLVFTNFDIILISLAFILIWYLMVAKVQFASGAQVIGKTVAATTAGGGGTTSALMATRGAYVLGVLGVVLKSLPNTISILVHDAMFATILVGLYSILRKYHYYKEKFGAQYILGIAISIGLLILFVALPYISIAYDASRLFFQLIIFLAPVFIIGCITIAKWMNKPQWDVVVILILLISCLHVQPTYSTVCSELPIQHSTKMTASSGKNSTSTIKRLNPPSGCTVMARKISPYFPMEGRFPDFSLHTEKISIIEKSMTPSSDGTNPLRRVTFSWGW